MPFTSTIFSRSMCAPAEDLTPVGCPAPKPIYYYLYLDESREIDLHKYYESQKAGYDVGMEWARLHWLLYHRSAWVSAWLSERRWERYCS